MLLQQLAHGSLAGQASLGGGHKHPDALDADHNAALVLLGDNALDSGVILTGLLNIVPALDGVETLLGQGDNTLLIVDAHDIGLDLVAHVDQIFDLYSGIVGQLRHRYVTGVLGAEIDIDLSGRNASDNACNLLPCI